MWRNLTLSHDNTAHEHLNGSDTLQWNLALASRLVQTQLMSEHILRDGFRVIDLVAQDQKWDLGKFLHSQKGVKFSLGLGETFMINGIDEENDSVHIGEIVLPQTTSWRPSAWLLHTRKNHVE